MDKNQREARRHQEDQALNRGLLWVAGAVVLECLLLLVNRYYINFYVSEVETAELVYHTLAALRLGAPIVGLALLAWAVIRFRKGQSIALTVAGGLACWALAVCAYVTLAYQKSGVQMLFLLVPAWAGLALVYYLYQREFFLAASASGMAAVGLWFVRYGAGVGIEIALILVGIAAVGGVSIALKKSGGVICRADGSKVQVVPKDASYTAVLISCLAGLIVVAASVMVGANIAYYLLFAVVAWLFALLVYYTVKMM